MGLSDVILGGALGFGLSWFLLKESSVVDMSYDEYHPTERTEWQIWSVCKRPPTAKAMKVLARFIERPAEIGLEFYDKDGNFLSDVKPLSYEKTFYNMSVTPKVKLPRATESIVVLWRSPDGSLVDLSRVSLEFVRGLL